MTLKLNTDNGLQRRTDRTPAANSRFAKAGVSCFYDSEVPNSSFVHLMKFSAENPRLRKAAKRYGAGKEKQTEDSFSFIQTWFDFVGF
jgi:hypothetical protein